MLQKINKVKNNLNLKAMFSMLIVIFSLSAYAQPVDNSNCPDNYMRNNGNGQVVTEFASNILPNSIYYLNALTSGNQGNFTFEWYEGITYPPVINKVWITPTDGSTYVDWEFGNNSTGSPFNPPGIPYLDEVKYTFYNNNLPNAGFISFELIDPSDGGPLCICSYPLSNGANSSGLLVNLAIVPPNDLEYSTSSDSDNSGTTGSSVEPTVFDGGGDVTYSISEPVSGVSIDADTGIITWSETATPGTHNLTIEASNGIEPNATTTYTLTIHSIPVVADIEGDTELAPETTTILSNETPNGVWSSSNTDIAIVDADGLVTAIDTGSVTISYTVTNSYGSTSKTHEMLVTDAGVGSGTNGGLESKSLGNALAERVFSAKKANKSDVIQYSPKTAFSSSSDRNSLNFTDISELLPDEGILGSGYKGYVTSPTDILTFTNAVDVAAVDYLYNGINKAVAFCTKTNDNVYSHTKPVCDRLKGAELLSVDTVQSDEYSFLLYYLKQTNNVMEYAVSFSIGTDPDNTLFELQSEWMTFDYVSSDIMYNFQLWSSDQNVLQKMLDDVVDKLSMIAPIKQIGTMTAPEVYVTKTDRDQENQLNLVLTIRNLTPFKTGTLIVSGKPNEQSINSFEETFDIDLKPYSDTNVTIPLKDIAEAEISLFVNDVREDYIYNNDGIWNIYASPSSIVKKFIISNDDIQPDKEEYRLFRNIELEATSSDYVTVYKMLRSGGLPIDLSEYNYFSFVASGTERVRIRLIKQSIKNFDDQYQILLPLSEFKNKEYALNLEDFKSLTFNEVINPDDIILISFTFEADEPDTDIIASMVNLRFTNKIGNSNLQEKQLSIYPNPVASSFNYSFISNTDESMTVEIMEPATGKVLINKSIYASKGQNNLKMNLAENIPSGVYFVSVSSADQFFKTKILIMN